MILCWVSLILKYILGVMGLHSAVNAIYRFVKYKEVPLIDLFTSPSTEEIWDMSLRPYDLLKKLMKMAILLFLIPIAFVCAYLVILDSMLWLNRELGLGLPFLAGMYGPNMEILRI